MWNHILPDQKFLFPHVSGANQFSLFPLHIYLPYSLTTLTNAPDYNTNKWSVLATIKFGFKLFFN